MSDLSVRRRYAMEVHDEHGVHGVQIIIRRPWLARIVELVAPAGRWLGPLRRRLALWLWPRAFAMKPCDCTRDVGPYRQAAQIADEDATQPARPIVRPSWMVPGPGATRKD